jgi:hypothetical protein
MAATIAIRAEIFFWGPCIVLYLKENEDVKANVNIYDGAYWVQAKSVCMLVHKLQQLQCERARSA